MSKTMKNYVKEYKGYKVPEGATHFVEKSSAYMNHFCKVVAGVEYVYSVDVDNPEWYEISSTLPLSSRNAIELPEVEQEWIPTHQLIDSALYIFKGTPVKLHTTVINRIGAEISIIELFGGDIYGVHSRHLTKIKTQEEKDREAFVHNCLEVTTGNEPHKIFHDLYEAGARFK